MDAIYCFSRSFSPVVGRFSMVSIAVRSTCTCTLGAISTVTILSPTAITRPWMPLLRTTWSLRLTEATSASRSLRRRCSGRRRTNQKIAIIRTMNPMLANAGGPDASPPVCAHASLISGPGPGRCAGARRKRSGSQIGPHLAHQVQIEEEVVQGRELRGEHLPGEREVPQGPPAEMPAGVAAARAIGRIRIARMTSVADHELTFTGEECPVPPVSGGQDTIEKVISQGRKGKQIPRRPHPHEVARPVCRQHPDGLRRDPRRLLG